MKSRLLTPHAYSKRWGVSMPEAERWHRIHQTWLLGPDRDHPDHTEELVGHGYLSVHSGKHGQVNLDLIRWSEKGRQPELNAIAAGMDFMAKLRLSPHNRRFHFLSQTYITAPYASDAERDSIILAMAALAHENPAPARALLQQWVHEFPKDNGWKCDMQFELDKAVREHPGISRAELWTHIQALTTGLTFGKPSKRNFDGEVDGLVHCGQIEHEPQLKSSDPVRYSPSAREPLPRNPLGLGRALGLTGW